MWKWKEICIEGFCLIYMDYNSKKDETCIALDIDGGEYELPNPDYEPNAVRPTPPDYCPRMVGYICLEHDCPHFGMLRIHENSEN